MAASCGNSSTNSPNIVASADHTGQSDPEKEPQANETVATAPVDGDRQNDSDCSSNADCEETSYCSLEKCDEPKGLCKERPGDCDDIFEPVCGCDGVTYANWCEAASAGKSLGPDEECT